MENRVMFHKQKSEKDFDIQWIEFYLISTDCPYKNIIVKFYTMLTNIFVIFGEYLKFPYKNIIKFCKRILSLLCIVSKIVCIVPALYQYLIIIIWVIYIKKTLKTIIIILIFAWFWCIKLEMRRAGSGYWPIWFKFGVLLYIAHRCHNL